jgi:hypothetical protein
MKKLILLFASMAIAFQGFSFTVSGNVVDKETGEGLEGLELYLETQTGLVLFTTSQTDGYFAFDYVQNGWNVLIFHNYEPTVINGIYYLRTVYPDTIVVNGEDITGILFEIEPHYTNYHVSGTLYDASTNQPIQNQTISLRLDLVGYGPSFFAWSDNSGHYTFNDPLPDWDYDFYAFPNAYYYGQDTILTIEKNGPTDIVVDFYLAPKSGVTVSGMIYNVETNEPIIMSGRTVLLLAIDPYWATTDENGVFTFVNVTPGYYAELATTTEDTAYVNTSGSTIYDFTIPEEGADSVVLYQKKWQTLHRITIDNDTFVPGETKTFRFKLVLDDLSYGSIWGVVLKLSSGLSAVNVSAFKHYYTNDTVFDREFSCASTSQLVWEGYHYDFYGVAHGNLEDLNDSVYADVEFTIDPSQQTDNESIFYEINYSFPCMLQPFSFGKIYLYNTNAPVGIATADNIDNNLNCYPNPAREKTTFKWTLAHPAKGKLSIFDLTGKEIAIIREGMFNEGTHQIDFRTINLNPGIYYYTFTSNDTRMTGKLIIYR